MSGNASNPAARSWLAPAARAIFIVAGCVAGALIFNYLLFRAAGLPFVWAGVVGAAFIAVPTIAAPLLAIGARRERELAGLRLKLNRASLGGPS